MSRSSWKAVLAASAAVAALVVVAPPAAAQSAPTIVLADARNGAVASEDGRVVVYSQASPQGWYSVYALDRSTGVTTLVSARSDGTPGDGQSYFPGVSRNGRFVTFVSGSRNLDPRDHDYWDDHYVKDLATGQLTLVSTNALGQKGNYDSYGVAQVSDDGRYVAFVNRSGNLDPVHPGGACDPENPECLDFFAEVFVKDLQTGAIIPVTLGGDRRGVSNVGLSMTADGQRLAFATTDALTPDDVDGEREDVYVVDLATGVLRLMSGDVTTTPPGLTVDATVPSLSADGSRVAFSAFFSPAWQAYVRDVDGGPLQLLSARADGAPGNGQSLPVLLSGDGRVAAFSTDASDLDPRDTDQDYDAYLVDVASGARTLLAVDAQGDPLPAQQAVAVAITGDGSGAFLLLRTLPTPQAPFGTWPLYLKDTTGIFEPPATVPSAPQSVAATAGPGSVTVTWSAPASDGGAALDSYVVTVQPGGTTATVPASTTTATVTGLTNGTAYTATVRAVNSVGASAESLPSPEVTPVAPPGAPTGVAGASRVGGVRVSWTPPVDTGGLPISAYVVRTVETGAERTVAGSATAVTINGLTAGTAYSFTVVARNAAGDSAPSAASPAAVPASGPPDAPTSVVATRGNASAVVSWTAPEQTGGVALSSYTVTASPGGKKKTVSAPATTLTMTGLTNGTEYTFTVTAKNVANQVSPASAPSAAVTPAKAPAAPPAPVATPYRAAVVLTWTAPADGGSAITGYVVETFRAGVSTGTVAVAASARSLTVLGLTNGASYRFSVRAVNDVGPGAVSPRSTAVKPLAALAPPPP